MINRAKKLGRYVAGGALGLPRLDGVKVEGDQLAAFEAAADRLLAADGGLVADLPSPKTDFLRWLADNRPVAFHGSSNPALDELSPIRMSRDASAFGDQQAVFATPDPVWATFFVVVIRDAAFRGMRNGSMGVPGNRIYPRWYYLALHRTDETAGLERFRPGTLYILPREGFQPEFPRRGIGGSAQMVSRAAVRPLARIPVEPGDIPFLHCTGAMEPGENQLRTIRQFGAAHRKTRRRS